jgi:hypothetical protein
MVYGGYAAPFSIARDNVPDESTSDYCPGHPLGERIPRLLD